MDQYVMENMGIDSNEEQFSVDSDAETQRISTEPEEEEMPGSQSLLTATVNRASDTSVLSTIAVKSRTVKKAKTTKPPGSGGLSIGKGKQPKKEHNGKAPKKFRKPQSRKLKRKGQVSADEYLVEDIVDKKREEDGKWKYFVKWVGWPSDTNTWEPIENLTRCENIVRNFEIEFEKRNRNPSDTDASFVKDASQENLTGAMEKHKLKNVDTKENMDFFIMEDCPEQEYMAPKQMIGVIDINGKLHYILDWAKPSGEIVRALIKATVFQVKYPRLVIKFYEKHVNFIRDNSAVPVNGV